MLQVIFPGINSKKFFQWLMGAPSALALGLAVRFWFYFLNDSFCRDETKLLLNIANKSFLKLLGPLSYGQEAPIPLLWLYRLFYLMGAGGELPLRAVSLLTSILALYLFYCLARRAIPDRRAILFVTWLMALSPGVILFAAIVKQYSIDILVSCVLFYLAVPWLIKSENNPSFFILVVAGGLAPWLSLPAIWIAGSIGLGMLVRGRRQGCKYALIFLGVLIFSFSLEYSLILKRCLHITEFINSGFLPLSFGGCKLFLQAVFYAYRGSQYNIYFRTSHIILLCLLLFGFWKVLRLYGWAWLLVLLLPLGLVFGASIAKVYPIFGRTLLFAVPGLYLLIGYGAVQLREIIPWPGLANFTLVLLLLPPIHTTVTTFMRPVGGVREALQIIAAQHQPQDLVFCDVYAAPTVAYYRLLKKNYTLSLKYGWQPDEWIEGEVDDNKVRTMAFQSLTLREKSIWLIAETNPYARSWRPGIFPGVLLYWQKLTRHLRELRPCPKAYITGRVQLLKFGPQLAYDEKAN
jgi:hypothetical protein